MYSIYSKKNYINPNFGFNKLSVENPFNFYGLENSKDIYGKPNYETFTHNTQRGKIYNDFILEENKQGVKTNPKQPPMTNTYDLNTVNVRTEQKYNPYFASYNYPQWMDKVKDLMNYGYNEEKATIYYTTDKPFNNENDYYGQTNITNGTKKYNTMSHAPLSSRVPKIEKNIYSTFTNKNYYFDENNKNDLNQNYNYNTINNTNFTNGVNYVDNTTIINNAQKPNIIKNNLSNSYNQNIVTSPQLKKQTYLNNYNVSNYLSSRINNKKEIKTNFDDSNFSSNCSNDYSYLDDVKPRKKHNISKSISYRINNRNNLNNDRDNDEYQNTNEFSKNKINNLKENGMPKEKLNYKSNNLNDDQKTRDYHRYNFWNNKDTIKIKNSLNFNGYSKHPEPKDIDAYLLK